LPDWPFLGQISEIWPRFKLVGLKNFSWAYGFFGLISSWLVLKMYLAIWLSFGLFYAEIGAYEGKYCNSMFFGNTFAKF